MALTPKEQAELDFLEKQLKVLERFESGQKLQQEAAQEQARLRPFISAARAVRPTLAGTGAMIGGTVAAPSAPVTGGVGPFAGGALGFGIGERLGRGFEQAVGLAPRETIPQALRSSAGDVLIGGGAEVLGAGVPAVGRGIARAGRTLGRLGQATTGIPQQEFRQLANRPGAFFTPQSVAGAGQRLGQAEARAGIPQIRTSDDVIEAFTGEELFGTTVKEKAKKSAVQLFDKIKAGDSASPNELVQGIRGVDDLIRKTPQMDLQQRRLLELARKKFVDELSNLNPALQQARSDFGTAKLASKFRQAFPVTKGTGDPSPGRGVFAGSLLAGGGFAAGGVPAALGALSLTSPFVTGGLTSTAGALFKGGQNTLGIPGIRRQVLGSAASALKKSDVFRKLFGQEQ